MLKNDACEDEVPHGSDGIIVAPLAAAVFEEKDERLVGEVVADEDEA